MDSFQNAMNNWETFDIELRVDAVDFRGPNICAEDCRNGTQEKVRSFNSRRHLSGEDVLKGGGKKLLSGDDGSTKRKGRGRAVGVVRTGKKR